MSGFSAASASSPACTEAWRVAPPLAGGCVAQARDGLVEDGDVIGIHHRLHGRHIGVAGKTPPSRGRSRSVRRSCGIALVHPRRREARVRLRQGWLRYAQVLALDSNT